ncbi:alanine racemase [Lacrimispora sp. 210928-DFI.3.58]|uniref:alanine racemase n=1 Tax=Lacrimispora sp. 210928-DFI.3.58 TaxID=2883214 RepID=UPI001D061550|nr:alanine racemase [Lacrimispora sp. 210928-DFI.3.58]MCB7317814.1 alanine racemase [Lacrimispora sp. 210928-DFI.3.58]
MRPYSRVYAAIDLDAVVSNMKEMKENLPPSTAMIGVVKTDGYGHGAVPVARAIDPYVEGYAVATIDEAIILRRHGIKKMILILGVTHESRYGELLRYDIRPAIFQYEKAKALSDLAVKNGKTAFIHLAVDTGMGRIGMKPDKASADMAERMSRLPGLRIEGMFTHFARADEADKAAYEAQYQAYLRFLGYLEERGVAIPIRHCSNSAGIIESLGSNSLDMVRAGISIYGLYPSDEVDREAVKLRPAMALKSVITYIKDMEPGCPISYGGTYVTEKPMRVATIPVGYGDGYLRSLSGKASVLIRGKRARILGRVCMDQFMVDVTDIPEACEDDEVTLIGRDGDDEITVEELAALGGGFHYEMVCNLGKRVPRVYVRGGQIVGTKDYFHDVYEGFGYM